MNLDHGGDSETRFAEYVAGLGSVIGHVERTSPLRDYCTGLMLPGDARALSRWRRGRLQRGRRRSTSRCCILSLTRPGRTRTCWPRCARWCCRRSRRADRSRHGSSTTPRSPSKASIRSACTTNIAVSSASRPIARWRCRCRLPIAASLPVAYRLYLPEDWTKDRARRKKAGVPKEIKFKTKPEIALEQIRWACEAGLPRGVALMDTAYGRTRGCIRA